MCDGQPCDLCSPMLAYAAAALLIVAPRAFLPALAEYVAAAAAERPTRVVALEDVLRESPGVDDPERLKRFLYEAWRNQAVGFALLVGDADVLPVRYMVLDRLTAPAFDTAFYPSDLYYADVAKPDLSFDDWNARKDGHHAGYFGEVHGEKHKDGPLNVDGIDYAPELAVGRWPVSTAAEARAVAAKTLVHRAARRGRAASRPTAALVAVDGWIENRPAMDANAAALAARFDVARFYWKGGGRDDGTPPPSEAATVAALEAGAALVLHSGHGNDDVWEKALGVGALPRLRNGAHPAVLMSAGCSTARFATLPPYEGYVDVAGREHRGTNAGQIFDAPPPPPAPYQRGRFNPTGLGERLVRDFAGGAVAYVGCNTGSQPCALTLQAAFAEAAGRPTDETGAPTTVGSAWRFAVTQYVDRERLRTLRATPDWYPASVFFQGMKFMLFGDPTATL